MYFTQPRHGWAWASYLHRMVADWDCIIRKLVRVADGRVKPGSSPPMTQGRESVFSALILLTFDKISEETARKNNPPQRYGDKIYCASRDCAAASQPTQMQ